MNVPKIRFNPTQTAPVKQSAEGIWNGTTLTGASVKMLVQNNGQFFMFFGTSLSLGSAYGSLSIDDANNITFNKIAGYYNSYISSNTKITSSDLKTSSYLTFTTDDTSFAKVNLNYDANYLAPLTLSQLQGNYSGAPMGQTSSFTIDANGNFTGTTPFHYPSQSSKCKITGKITPNASRRFALAVITPEYGCSAYDGVAIFLVEGSGVGQKVYIGMATGYAATLYGQKL